MAALDYIRNLWHQIKPLLIYLLPLLVYLIFYYQKNKKENLKKIIQLFLFLAFAYSFYLFTKIIVRSITQPTVWDFTAFFLYGKVAASGHNFYLPENFQHVFYSLSLPPLDYTEFIRESVNVGFFYPPPTIFLFIPLGFLSYKTALICWTIFNLFFAFGAIYLIYDLFFKSYKLYGLLFVATLFFLFPAVGSTIFFDQTNFILLFLLLLMKKYEDRSFAGIILTLAFFVKPYMIAFGIIFLLRKQWKTVIYSLVSALILCGITILTFGITPFLSYIFSNASKRLPLAAFSEDINQSFQAVLLRHHLITLDAPIVYAIIAIGILAITAFYLLYLQKKGFYDYVWAILLLVVLIIYPGTLSHYGVMLLFIIFQLFESKQISLKWYVNFLLIGLFYYYYYLNPNSLFTCLCILLIIMISKSFYNSVSIKKEYKTIKL